MQTPRRTCMVVIKDYDHMMTMDEDELDETNKLIVDFSLNLKAPFGTSTFTSKRSNSLSRFTH